MDMKNALLLTVVLMQTVLTAGCMESMMRKDTIGASYVDYFGYTNCVKLENENTTVILGPHCGGRILEYSLNGKNSLYLDPEQKGWVYEPGKDVINPMAGRFDIGPEGTTPSHPDLRFGAWTAEITGPRSARMTSVKDGPTGIQLVRDFTLDKNSSKLTCTQTMINVSDKITKRCYWSRTLAVGGGICIMPLTPDSRFPREYIMYGPGPVMNYQPEDPNIRIRDNFLEIIGTPQRAKLGVDSYAGWIYYLTKNDLLFIKRFPTYPERVYNEMAAITISIWYYQDIMCELEPIGPMEVLKPGKSASFTEEWWLVPYEFPKPGTDADLTEITKIAQKLAK
jgi:hypothetical protein